MGVPGRLSILTPDDKRHRKIDDATADMLRWLGISQRYRIQLEFVDELDSVVGSPGRCAVASISEDYPYKTLTVTWRRDAVDGFTPEVLTELMLHEMLHVLLFGEAYRFVTPRIGRVEYSAWMTIEEAAVDLAAHMLVRMKEQGAW